MSKFDLRRVAFYYDFLGKFGNVSLFSVSRLYPSPISWTAVHLDRAVRGGGRGEDRISVNSPPILILLV